MTILMNNKYLLLLILVLSIALRLAFFSGYVSGDDQAYIARAQAYAQADYSQPYSHWGARSGIVFPTAAIFKAFGVHYWSPAIIPLVLSILTIIIAYFFATYLFDKHVGLLAALLLAIFPMNVIFASHLFPYAFLSFWTLCAFFAFYKGAEENYSSYIFLAGFCLGIAYLCRITALYSLLFFVLYIIWKREFRLKYLYFVLGLGIVFIAESVFSYGLWDSFVTRYEVLISKTSPGLDREFDLRWLVEPFIRPLFEQEIGLFYIVFLLAIIYQIFKNKNKKAYVLLLWIIPIFLYLSYGTTSYDDYRTLRRLPRYYSVIIVPAIILSAYMIYQISNKKIYYTVIGILFIFSVGCLSIDNSRYIRKPLLQMEDFVETNNKRPVLIDRALFFDYIFLNNFQIDDNVHLLTNPNDLSDELKRIKIVKPDVQEVYDIEETHMNGFVVLSPRYYDFQDYPFYQASTQEAVFVLDNPIFFSFVQNQYVQKLLKIVRDPKRVENLARIKPQRVLIYKLPERN